MVDRVKSVSVEAIAEMLREETGELDLAPGEARLFMRVLRQLGQGQSVSVQDVATFASGERMTLEEADEILLWLAEKNEEGEIIGLGGLSLNDGWTHRLHINGRRHKTWCAFDTLYLPPLLGQAAEIESPDPVSREWIKLAVGPEGLEGDPPDGAVISIVIPSIKEKGIRSAERVWTAFCQFSHYFESIENAEQWFEGRGQEPLFLSLEQGFELGQLWFEKLGRYT